MLSYSSPSPKTLSVIDTYDENSYTVLLSWLGGVRVTMLDLRSKGREFDSRLGRYQVVTTRMGDCL